MLSALAICRVWGFAGSEMGAQIDIEEAIAAKSPFAGLKRGHYATIVSDPPWHFRTRSEVRQTRATANHYQVMSIPDICAMPVADLAAKDAVLLLWVVNPMLPQGLDVMKSWGFQFKTIAFTWAKTTTKTDGLWAPKFHMGLGYWSRQNSESCLLGVRGKPKRTGKDVRQLIVAPRREHSRKPEIFYSNVERLVPGPYLDMFSREPRDGWDQFGNQAEKFAPSGAQLGGIQ